jgi:adenine phosphoribosyltransferase
MVFELDANAMSVQDLFEMQAGAIQPGQNVVIVDDLIATGISNTIRLFFETQHVIGGSAKAAGELVAKQGGKTLEYLFMIEIMFLKAASKLDAPLYSIVHWQADD